LASGCLLAFPFIQVGTSLDFMMRASIPALAVLAVLTGEGIVGRGKDGSVPQVYWRSILVCFLAAGSITPAHEIARSISVRPTPYTRCSLIRAWPSSKVGPESYVAPLSSVPSIIRPRNPVAAPETLATECWSRPWWVQR
jgi:hypothetical protein